MRVLGIMSGTSVDSVDYVICTFNASGQIRFDEHWQVAFSSALRSRIRAAAADRCTSYHVAQLHHDLGRFYARGVPAGKHLDLVGLHGQTIFHRPHHPDAATFQIGEPAYLSEKLSVPVVSNFRAADLAAGGQGAPLATIFHLHAFGRKGRNIAINNLGGISNVTSIAWRTGSKPAIVAFDTGPANMLMDLAMQKTTKGARQFDRNGALARRGVVCDKLLGSMLKHPFFAKQPPKSTGRELFGEAFLAKILRQAGDLTLSDLLATLAAFTARSIERNYRLHLPAQLDEVILCGGGAKNAALVHAIKEALCDFTPLVSTSTEHGWKPEVIEAAAFALLAWLRFNRKPGNIPQTTGASGARQLGVLG